MKQLKKSLPVKTVRLVTDKRLMSEEVLDSPMKVEGTVDFENNMSLEELVAEMGRGMEL